ncbi:MAG TPA: hypothetical protein VLK33_16010 [Terriglobales bacterium]|nr:hypothetical protein [Terriglobales bacterium]
MAMVITKAARSSGNADFKQPAAERGVWLDRIPFRYPRFPASFPGPGGATHPLAALWGLGDYAHKLQHDGIPFPWQPQQRTGQTLINLEQAIKDSPTLIYGVGETGIPHVVVPIEHSENGWKILDPGTPTEKNPVTWSDERLQKWWRNYSILYPAGTMISLIPAGAASAEDARKIRTK